MPANNRSQVKVSDKNTLICDSYNANPTSMNSALESFVILKGDHKLLILGDMLELGDKSVEEHTRVLDMLQLKKIDNVLLVGPVFQKVAANSAIKSFPDVTRLFDHLKKNPVEGHTILIKGSRGIGLEMIYELL